MTYSEKMQRILEDRITLLKIAKVNIQKSNIDFNKDISNITELLIKDELTTKEYKAIVGAKKIIEDLTKSIAEAESIDEIIEIRKKINYYINKIKKEIKKRNISEEKIAELNSTTTILRKNIATYLRYLKRETKIEEAKEIMEKEEKSSEETKQYKKIINNEIRYNRDNLNKINQVGSQKPKSLSTKIIEFKTSFNESENEDNIAILESDKAKKKSYFNSANIENLKTKLNFKKIEDKNEKISSDDEHKVELDNARSRLYRINNIENRYGIWRYKNKTKSIIIKVIDFIKMIPTYFRNKKIVNTFTHTMPGYLENMDVSDYIEGIIEKNPIKLAFDDVFVHSSLFFREQELIDAHEEYYNRIVNYNNIPNTYSVREEKPYLLMVK